MDKKIVLLVDDDTDDTELFCEALCSVEENIVCHCTADGGEAMAKLNELSAKPHLIFLDINMPVMSGWQCLKALKEDERYTDIPVIIVSTSSNQREIEIAQDLGALCYFTKPNDFDDLTRMLRVIVTNPGSGLAAALQNLHRAGSPFIYSFAEDKANSAQTQNHEL